MNPDKKARRRKLNVVEPGKSVRNKHNKPIENRIGWDNGRSRKYAIECPEHTIQAYKFPVNVNCINQAEISTVLNPSGQPMQLTGKCGYRTARLGTGVTTETYNRRLAALSKSIQSHPDNPGTIVETSRTLSPNKKSLVVITHYRD